MFASQSFVLVFHNKFHNFFMHRVQRIIKKGNLASTVGLKKDPTRRHESWNSASCRWKNVKIKSADSHIISELSSKLLDRRFLFSHAASCWKYIILVVDEWIMSMEYGMNDTDKWILKYWKKNLSKCHFIYHKSHLDCTGIQTGPPKWESSHSA